MLAIADSEGYVGASVPGLSKAANVSMEETLAALERFSGPDEYSRTKEHDGRRIESAPGGWRILNFVAHRDGNEDQREKWARQKRLQRLKKPKVGGGGSSARERLSAKAHGDGDEETAARMAEPVSGLKEEGVLKSSPAEGNSHSEDLGPIPEIGTREQTGQPEPEVESGQLIDGHWVKD